MPSSPLNFSSCCLLLRAMPCHAKHQRRRPRCVPAGWPARVAIARPAPPVPSWPAANSLVCTVYITTRAGRGQQQSTTIHHEGPGGVPGRRRRRRRGAAVVVARRRRGAPVVVVVGRPGGEAAAEGGPVQGLRRGGQREGVAPQGVPLDQGPLHRPRPPPLLTSLTVSLTFLL